MNWLITGGYGFIGKSLVKKLLEDKENNIRIIDNFSVVYRGNLDEVCEPKVIGTSNCFSRVEYSFTNITNDSEVYNLAEGSDIIVHLAARPGVEDSILHPGRYVQDNIVGTFNILEAARKNNIKKVIFASSGASIGVCEPPVNESKVPDPVSPYGATKLCGEALCSAYYHSYGINTISLRFSNVYGPYSTHKKTLISNFIKAAIHNDLFEIHGDGEQKKDFIYIDDLLEAVKLCAIKDTHGIFQVCTGVGISVNNIVKILSKIFEDRGIYNTQICSAEPRVGDIRENWADNTKIKEALGWDYKIDAITGLTKTVDWFLNLYKK